MVQKYKKLINLIVWYGFGRRAYCFASETDPFLGDDCCAEQHRHDY